MNEFQDNDTEWEEDGPDVTKVDYEYPDPTIQRVMKPYYLENTPWAEFADDMTAEPAAAGSTIETRTTASSNAPHKFQHGMIPPSMIQSSVPHYAYKAPVPSSSYGYNHASYQPEVAAASVIDGFQYAADQSIMAASDASHGCYNAQTQYAFPQSRYLQPEYPQPDRLRPYYPQPGQPDLPEPTHLDPALLDPALSGPVSGERTPAPYHNVHHVPTQPAMSNTAAPMSPVHLHKRTRLQKYGKDAERVNPDGTPQRWCTNCVQWKPAMNWSTKSNGMPMSSCAQCLARNRRFQQKRTAEAKLAKMRRAQGSNAGQGVQ